MRAALSLAGLLIVLGIGYAIYSSQIQHFSNGRPVKQQIDLVGIKTDLLSLAQAERLYMAENGSYATLDRLHHSNMMSSLPAGNRAGYDYSAEVDSAKHFRITAGPTGASGADLPTFSIDETMRITQQP